LFVERSKNSKAKQANHDLMTLDQCLAFNSDFKTIRVHKATQQASYKKQKKN
jgi:hypothetical protein